MSKFAQFSGLIFLSAALHVAVFWGMGADGGAPSGSGGVDGVTLAAAPAALVQVVKAWGRPAEAQQAAPLSAPPMVPPAPVPPPATRPPQVAPPPAILPLPERQATRLPAPLPPAPQSPPPPEVSQAPPEQVPPPVPRIRPTRRPEKPPAVTAPVRQALATPTPPPPPAQTAPRDPAPASQAAPQPAARAAGIGGGSRAGESRDSDASAPSAAQVSALMARWGKSITTRVKRRQRYPSGTTATGQVKVQLSLTHTGQLTGVRILRGSGDGALDQAALRAVQGARLPKAPRGLSGTHSFSITLNFAR